jgi:hypothetical protein
MPASPRNDYFLCFPDRTERWSPYEPAHPHWIRTGYFGRVFQAMEEHLDLTGLTVYLTANERTLPSYGPNVVAVLQEDQPSRVPAYFDRVRATFTCHGIHQSIRPNPLREPSLPNVLSAGMQLLNWGRRLPGQIRRAGLRRTRNHLPPIYTIPLGYANQVEVPYRDVDARAHDLFFAGSVNHLHGPQPAWRRWVRSPKRASRERMVDALTALRERRPDLSLDLHIRSSFRAAVSSSASWYSERMMNAKVCPIPRGTSLESFRFFEALRAGCIPIVEALPSRWFYDGAPALHVSDWRDAPALIEALLDDPARVRAQHQAVLEWWRTTCSEAAVGRYMARGLAATVDAVPVPA